MILLSYKTLILSIGFVQVLVRLCGLVNFMSEELCFRFQEADDSQFPDDGDDGDDVGHTTLLLSAVVYEDIFETFHGAGSGERQTGRTVRGIRSLVVDKSGAGNYKTVQEAVDSVNVFNTQRVLIQIRQGTFFEKVYIPSSKPYITFQGAGLDKTIITWSDNANVTGSTYTTASVAVDADYFIGRNISFKNSAPRPGPEIVGAQAVAFRAAGDRGAFYGCGFYGNQDTLNDHTGRHFFKECYIEGEIDFIFGNGRSLYQSCIINSTAAGWGAITAHRRQSQDEDTGYGFIGCSIVGTGTNLLGRAWGPAARVVFSSTHMENIISSRGWDDWKNTSADSTVYFGEFNNSGLGSNATGRVEYARILTAGEADLYTQISWIDGSQWLPENDFDDEGCESDVDSNMELHFDLFTK